MTNLAEFHDLLTMQDKEKMVRYWNERSMSKITLATLPFIDAVTFKKMMYTSTVSAGCHQTFIKIEFKYEERIKKVIYLATKGIPWLEWAFGETKNESK